MLFLLGNYLAIRTNLWNLYKMFYKKWIILRRQVSSYKIFIKTFHLCIRIVIDNLSLQCAYKNSAFTDLSNIPYIWSIPFLYTSFFSIFLEGFHFILNQNWYSRWLITFLHCSLFLPPSQVSLVMCQGVFIYCKLMSFKIHVKLYCITPQEFCNSHLQCLTLLLHRKYKILFFLALR